MKYIFINEWIGFLRKRLFILVSLIFASSLIVVTWLGISQNEKQIKVQQLAQKHIRSQWDSMKPTNPHGAAHFGSYAFKPNSILSSIDEGVNTITGNVLRLEGHTQNDLVYSEASQSLLVSKFGKLKPSLLFQFIIPLFLIFLGFNTYTSERESGRLKLILIQGSSLKKVLFGKIISVWGIGILLLVFTLIIQILFNGSSFNLDTFLRLSFLTINYSAYYLIVTILTVLHSVIFKSGSTALSFTITIWILWTIFLPKIAGNAIEKISPLPTRVQFQKVMEEDRSKGIDGHNPSSEREKELEKTTLAKYKVDSLSQLPINFDGLVMQADEEYGNIVWDKHFGELYGKMKSQKRNYQFTGLINPFASIQNLSMGSAGTDMFHHLDFLKQAENYRRVFIKTLNDKHAYGGSKTGDWDWKVDKTFFQSVKDFHYQTPSIQKIGSKYLIDLLLLFGWVILLLALINYISKRTYII
jgi:ABC-2 type transport system permease protein